MTGPWRAALPLLLLVACGRSHDPAADREARLAQHNARLVTLLEAVEQGGLAGARQVVVGVHERLANAILKASLPIEQTFDDRVVVRLEVAQVSFERGLGVVEVEGRAWLRKHPDIAAEVKASGVLGDVVVDGRGGILRAHAAVEELSVRSRARGMWGWLRNGRLERWLESVGRERLESMLPPLELPARLRSDLELPEIHHDLLNIEAASVPFDLAVSQVLAVDGWLWTVLELQAAAPVGSEGP